MYDELLTIVKGYRWKCYYPHGDISQKREQSVIQLYGVDPRDTVIAIIDSTVMGFTRGGSAENGMALTLKGIYWKNLWAFATRKNHYTWDEMVELHQRLEVSSGKVRFEPEVEFYAPAEFRPEQVINLLQNVTKHYIELRQQAQAKNSAPESSLSITPAAVAIAGPESTAPSAGSHYETALVNAMALLTCTSGSIDEDILEMAIAFISGEGEVVNVESALARFSSQIESITTDAAKAPAFLKLRQSRLIAECRPLSPVESERVGIMLDGIVETVDPSALEAVTKLADTIRKATRSA